MAQLPYKKFLIQEDKPLYIQLNDQKLKYAENIDASIEIDFIIPAGEHAIDMNGIVWSEKIDNKRKVTVFPFSTIHNYYQEYEGE